MPNILEHLVVYPTERRYAVPLLLLHGAWHGAWCWQPAMDDFARRGFEVHAFSLRGHGASDGASQINWWSLRDYVRDLATAVEAMHPRPVVVGHSMGGYITQLYLTEHTLPGVVLLCSMPHTGTLAFLARYTKRHPLAMLHNVVTLNTRRLVGTPALARDAFFRDDIAPDELALHTARLVPESLRVATESALTTFPDPTRNRSPLLAIAAERDRVFTLNEQRAMARVYGTELVVVPGAAHDLMLDPAWPLAADAIGQSVQHWTQNM